MGYDFERIVDRRGTDNFKWDKLEERYGRTDILPFWIADMEFRTAPEIVEALKQRAEHGIYGYSFKSDRFYEAVLQWYRIRHQWEIKKEWITGSPGVMAALSICIENFSEPGSSIITLSPAYPGFYERALCNGRRMVVSDLILAEGAYGIDYEDLERKITKNSCRLFVFCSPHNPGGRVWKKEELEKLLAICRRTGVTVISDDIHSDIVYSGSRYIPLASIAGDFRNHIVTLSAPGKTFNLTGTATSVAVIPDGGMRRKFNETLERYELGDGNLFGNLAAQTAYERGGDWLDALLEYLEGNREFILWYLKAHDIPIKPVCPEGTYMMLLNCNLIGRDDKEIKRRLIEEAGILLNQGDTFGRNTSGYARINFACPRTLLEKGMERLRRLC